MNAILATQIKLITDRKGSSFAQPGKAQLLKLAEPLPIGISYRSRSKRKERTTRYIYVSTSTVMGEVETYVFACYSSGRIFDYSELYGSMKGTSDHNKVLAAMGIEVV